MTTAVAVIAVVLVAIGAVLTLNAVVWSLRNITPERYEDFPPRSDEGHSRELIKLLFDLTKVNLVLVAGGSFTAGGSVLAVVAAIMAQ